MVPLPADVLERYGRLSLYNSPYPAHDRGCAVDLYPGTSSAPSPVAGEILDVRSVAAPDRPYAAEQDHLVLVDTGDRIARVLHVDPAVTAGDRVAVGDDLGTLVRSGYFAPWVDNHLHLGFRPYDADPYRASGSVRVELDLGRDLTPLQWDGTGRVVETGDTYAVLDAPTHPAPGERWAGVAVSTSAGEAAVLDGGLPHYAGGGILGRDDEGAVELAGTAVGTASSRDVTWDDVTVTANDEPVTGLSLFLARDAGFGGKLVCPDREFDVGEEVTVDVRRGAY